MTTEPLVRSTACQYVLRLASREPPLYESSHVRRALALYLDADALDWFSGAVDEFRLADHFLDVLDHFVIPN